MATNGELKQSQAQRSGRSSIVRGAKYMRGFVIRPEQVLALFHDTQPELPIPADAQFVGIGFDGDAGTDSAIMFYFTSVTAPWEHCLNLKPQLFLKMLVQLADGLLPADSELDGIEISNKWTLVLLRIKSSHWPPTASDVLPMMHLRYDLGRLTLCSVDKSVENERKIVLQ